MNLNDILLAGQIKNFTEATKIFLGLYSKLLIKESGLVPINFYSFYFLDLFGQWST